jgi:hypothetical protein
VQDVDKAAMGNGKGKSTVASKLVEAPTPTLPDPVLHKRDGKGEDGGNGSAADDLATKMKVNSLAGMDGDVTGLGLNGLSDAAARDDDAVDKDGMKAVPL